MNHGSLFNQVISIHFPVQDNNVMATWSPTLDKSIVHPNGSSDRFTAWLEEGLNHADEAHCCTYVASARGKRAIAVGLLHDSRCGQGPAGGRTRDNGLGTAEHDLSAVTVN
jgi:hypothetical protein